MQVIVFTFIAALIVYFLVLCVVVAIELNARRKQQERFLVTGITTHDAECSDVKLYTATFSYLFDKWLRFTGPLFVSVGGIGSIIVVGFVGSGEPLVEAIWQTACLLFMAILIFGIPMVIMLHLFGARIGMTLLAYAEYGLCQEGLLYCPFTRWYLVPWRSVTQVRSTRVYRGTIPGYLIEVAGIAIFPMWYQNYLFVRANRFSLVLLCLLPDALELKEEIEKRITQYE